MRKARVLGLALALHAAGCRKPDAPAPSAKGSAATPSSAELVVKSVIDAAGLHVQTGSLSRASLWGFTDIGLDASRTSLRIVLAKHGAPLAQLLPEGGLAVINGGYFEPDFRPSTWLVSDGVELAPKTDTSKGGVLAVGANGVFLGPFAELSFQPALALQSFPLIVEQAGLPGIHSDDGRRAARTVACLVGDRLHLIVITAPRGDGPTLFESVALLRDAPPRGLGCRIALNLDGGPSSGVWFGAEIAARQRAPLANVAYAVAIMPRAATEGQR
jgi:Phosphodiester glycosidase